MDATSKNDSTTSDAEHSIAKEIARRFSQLRTNENLLFLDLLQWCGYQINSTSLALTGVHGCSLGGYSLHTFAIIEANSKPRMSIEASWSYANQGHGDPDVDCLSKLLPGISLTKIPDASGDKLSLVLLIDLDHWANIVPSVLMLALYASQEASLEDSKSLRTDAENLLMRYYPNVGKSFLDSAIVLGLLDSGGDVFYANLRELNAASGYSSSELPHDIA